MEFELGVEKIEFKPMTWGLQKKVFEDLVAGLAEAAKAKAILQQLTMSALKGEGELEFKVLLDVINSVPGLIDKILVRGLDVKPEQLDAATGMQVLSAIELFIKDNALEQQWVRSKKVWTLLAGEAPPQG